MMDGNSPPDDSSSSSSNFPASFQYYRRRLCVNSGSFERINKFFPSTDTQLNPLQNNNNKNNNNINNNINNNNPDEFNPNSPLYISQHNKCNKYLNSSLSNSLRVKYMISSMDNIECPIKPLKFIQCIPCLPIIGGAMYINESNNISIAMCQNRIKSQDVFDTVATHELIHAYDYCRADIEFSNLDHHACTEIRAASLSGDCSFMRELKIGYIALSNHHFQCVKRRATKSLLANNNCTGPDQAKAVIEKVFDRCSIDVEPFGSIPI